MLYNTRISPRKYLACQESVDCIIEPQSQCVSCYLQLNASSLDLKKSWISCSPAITINAAILQHSKNLASTTEQQDDHKAPREQNRQHPLCRIHRISSNQAPHHFRCSKSPLCLRDSQQARLLQRAGQRTLHFRSSASRLVILCIA